MDHILENEGKPIPDLGAVAETSNPASAQPMDEDDAADLEALQNLGVKGAAAVSATQDEARVRDRFSLHGEGRTLQSTNFTEHQVFGVWQDLQDHSSGELPCRKEWSRSV